MHKKSSFALSRVIMQLQRYWHLCTKWNSIICLRNKRDIIICICRTRDSITRINYKRAIFYIYNKRNSGICIHKRHRILCIHNKRESNTYATKQTVLYAYATRNIVSYSYMNRKSTVWISKKRERERVLYTFATRENAICVCSKRYDIHMQHEILYYMHVQKRHTIICICKKSANKILLRCM